MERDELVGFLHGRFFPSPAQLKQLRATGTPSELAKVFASKGGQQRRRQLVRFRFGELLQRFN
jgi:hypothetical protein